MGSRNELLVHNCEDCKYVDQTLNVPEMYRNSYSNVHYCTLTSGWQLNEMCGKVLKCAGFNPKIKEWDQ